MRRLGRPIGLILICAVLVLNGLASLLDAFDFTDFAARRSFTGTVLGLVLPGSVVAIVVGLLLIKRAYGVWTMKRSTWLTTVLLVMVKAASGALRFIILPTSLRSLLIFAVPLAAAVYLLLPNVRNRFGTVLPKAWVHGLDFLMPYLERHFPRGRLHEWLHWLDSLIRGRTAKG